MKKNCFCHSDYGGMLPIRQAEVEGQFLQVYCLYSLIELNRQL